MQKRNALDRSDTRYRVNTVAQRLGVHTATLKRLEARGAFTPQRDCANHRRYTERDIQRLAELLFGRGEGDR